MIETAVSHRAGGRSSDGRKEKVNRKSLSLRLDSLSF